MFFTYILQSYSDGTFYIGHTSNLERRLEHHNLGLSNYTRKKIPWCLVYSESYKTKRAAIIREKELKSQKSRRYIESLIKSQK